MTHEEFVSLMETIRADRDDSSILEGITQAVDIFDGMSAERDNEIASRDSSILELQETVTRVEAERDDAKRRYFDLYTKFINSDGEEKDGTPETNLVDDDNEVYKVTTYEDALSDW